MLWWRWRRFQLLFGDWWLYRRLDIADWYRGRSWADPVGSTASYGIWYGFSRWLWPLFAALFAVLIFQTPLAVYTAMVVMSAYTLAFFGIGVWSARGTRR